MGSHGHLPFGCTNGSAISYSQHRLIGADDPNGVQGIGLPSGFIPPGQPLLSEQENDQMQEFFSAFDGDGQARARQPMPGHFQENMAHLQQLQMPQQYVGHESYVRSPQAMDWHAQAMRNFTFNQQMLPMSTMHTPTSPYTNGQHIYPHTHQTMPGFTADWQQQFPHHAPQATRAGMHFGSDPSFISQGPFVAPDGATEPEMSFIDSAVYRVNSASNTNPNSRAASNPGSNANTEPSSPVATKKRKLNNVFNSDALRMTSMSVPASTGYATKASPPASHSRRKSRQSFVKHEQPPTPLSKTPTVHEDEVQEEDAEYDEDEDEQEQKQSASPPAPWPSSKARPLHKPALPSKPTKSRKKSASAASPAKPSKPRRQSSSVTAASRTPLTAEQKKANHTNSEQRRRDATAKAYAELYDLVPELDEMGKQSTMKKLEVVVEKVRTVKQQLEFLREMTGRDPITGRLNAGQIAANPYAGGTTHLSGWS
ncbi:hypothetical protein LTR64_007609 [Lithohypha guttulata]|uniref:uncharacterized protein n=1 Tax=Lithohypha guttulata TaxID=1690604 RepID=UPI002DE09CDD|nr:hypothetical protein LTR51_007118 [Lithohypha guttulata]